MLEQCASVCILVLSLHQFGVKGLDLPSYIPKCSISDPKFNDCVKENANKVIPIVAKGDPELGTATFSPFTIKEAPILCKNLTFVLIDTYSDDVKDVRVTNVSFDWKRKKFVFQGVLDRAELLARNYSIIDGKVINIPASGHGKFNMTVVGVTIEYAGGLRLYKKMGEEYLEFVDTTVKSSIKRGYYYFENLKSPEKDDVNDYIEKNWKKFRAQMKPAFRTYLTTIVSQPLSAVFQKVPFRKIFLP